MNLGIVGSGAMVREVLPVFRECGYRLTALCGTERSRETVESLCTQHGIAHPLTDYEALLACTEVETVYVAVPNHLHYEFALRALRAGKHVILEKPATGNSEEFSALAASAREKGLFLFEAISTIYLPCFAKMREWLDRLGEPKRILCNFSQRSHRYDAFCEGRIAPCFDPEKNGGALMDLNVYHIHLLTGLWGAPRGCSYLPNRERGVDIGGVLTMDYGSFQAICVAAKDCDAPCGTVIEAERGYMVMQGSANTGGPVTLHLNDGREERFEEKMYHRTAPEFRFFREQIENGDTRLCRQAAEESLTVMKVLTEARKSAGILFPCDR